MPVESGGGGETQADSGIRRVPDIAGNCCAAMGAERAENLTGHPGWRMARQTVERASCRIPARAQGKGLRLRET